MVSSTSVSLDELLPRLTHQHQQALTWFLARAGQVVGWPTPTGNEPRVATLAKGIYKPAWSEYALSIKQTLNGPYPDKDPVIRPDGTWRYDYFQEGQAEGDESNFTNRGLLKCIRDKVPVGVIRQVSNRSPVTYHVLGLALPVGREDGYFRLEGFASNGHSHGENGAGASRESLLAEVEQDIDAESFEPADITDARRRVLRAIVQRRGQRGFRAELLRAYGGRCAISGADAQEALEAAHIVPYLGPQTNQVRNGLLLRADLHTLFDLGRIVVDTSAMSVVLAPSLVKSSYSHLAGKPLSLPALGADRPSKAALDAHREHAQREWK